MKIAKKIRKIRWKSTRKARRVNREETTHKIEKVNRVIKGK